MTVAELIRRLQEHPADAQVMLLDSHNGGGDPRELNLGPTPRIVRPAHAESTADCEDLVGETVIVLGYGCY